MADRPDEKTGAMTDRRAFAYALVGCLAGAGLALFAATRTWVVEHAGRASPLPDLGGERTGGDLVPWLPAVALVGLAGAGALLATRGLARSAVGALLAACGLAAAAGAVTNGFGLAGDAAPAWPAATALGGVVLAAGGAAAAVRGRRWPVMGPRYQRSATAGPAAGAAAPATPTPTPHPRQAGTSDPGAREPGSTEPGSTEPGSPEPGAAAGGGTRQAWEALDRGEDPTDDG